MGFMDRIHTSWELVKLSWHLLMQDKELLLFPILSTIGAILLFIGIVMPSVLAGTEDISWLVLALWYLAASFVTIFMNAALFACVKKRMHGGDPTIGYGLKEAGKRVVPIFLWSLVSATVGLILRALEERAEDNFIAQIVIGIIGAAWSLMTMFVVPVIVMEGVNPLDAMRRSANLVKKTWGENLVADVSMGLAFFALYALGILVGLVALFTTSGIVLMVTLGVVVLYIVIVAVFQSTMNMIFDAVLYSYATGDNVPLQFKNTVGTAFKKKERR